MSRLFNDLKKQMERPTMKENLKGYSLEEAHKLYTDCPELYRHIVRLDEYIDNLEDELNKLLISGVSICIERAKKYARHQHFLGTQRKELVEFDDWKAKD